ISRGAQSGGQAVPGSCLSRHAAWLQRGLSFELSAAAGQRCVESDAGLVQAIRHGVTRPKSFTAVAGARLTEGLSATPQTRAVAAGRAPDRSEPLYFPSRAAIHPRPPIALTTQVVKMPW